MVAEVPAAAPFTDPAPVPAGGGALEEAFPEAYLRRIGSESREAWGERTRTVKERRVAEEPAAAPVTEPAPAPVPRTPDGTWIVMAAGPHGGNPRRDYSPMDKYFGGYHGNQKVYLHESQSPAPRRTPLRGAPSIFLRRGPWKGRKSPPLLV